jgi:hypothetical protein
MKSPKPIPYPFRITAGEYISMTRGETGQLHSEVYKLFRKILEAKWAKGLKQVIICDGEVEFETEDEEMLLSDVIHDIAQKHNRACYVFSAPAMIDSG